MGLFNFWKKKAEEKTLSELVREYAQLQAEYRRERAMWQKQLDEEKQRRDETEKRLVEELSKKRVVIHYYPGTQLFVVIDGEILYSSVVSDERYRELKLLKEAQNVKGIRDLLLRNPEEDEEGEEGETEEPSPSEDEQIGEIVEQVHALVHSGDFDVEGDTVTLKGVARSVPPVLVSRFTETYTQGRMDEYNALKNFWRWLVLDPNARATEDFYDRIKRYNPHITEEGFVLAVRWVVAVEGTKTNRKLVEYISRDWLDIKKRRKKGPKNFEVYQQKGKNQWMAFGFGKTPEDPENWEHVGNLDDLYTGIENLQPEQTYTDGRTHSMDIRIGRRVSIPRTQCDESTAECSSGLHACFNLRDHHGDNGTHNVKILVAVCPKDIVSAPYNSSKFRCSAYLPLAVLREDEDYHDFLERGEGLDLLKDYFQLNVEELIQQAETQTVKELTTQRLLPERLVKLPEVEAKAEVAAVIQGFNTQLNRVQAIV